MAPMLSIGPADGETAKQEFLFGGGLSPAKYEYNERCVTIRTTVEKNS